MDLRYLMDCVGRRFYYLRQERPNSSCPVSVHVFECTGVTFSNGMMPRLDGRIGSSNVWINEDESHACLFSYNEYGSQLCRGELKGMIDEMEGTE